MNNNWGSFLCPQCQNNKIQEKDNYDYMFNYNKSKSEGYQYWMNRKIFINKEPKIEWIFYKEKDKKWNCCSCCKMCKIFGEVLICCCTDHKCEVTILCYPCSFIFYILFCFVYDLCSFLCFGKMTYFGVKGKKEHYSSDVYDDSNIWDEMGGLTEEEMNNKKIWLCSNCKYYNKSFTDFIPKNNINNNNINNNNINNTNINDNNINDNNSHNNNIPKYNIRNDNNQGGNIYNNIISLESMKNARNLTININNNNPESKSERNLKDEVMAINFTSVDQTINYCIPCKKSDKFYIIENKLYEEYPQYKNKQVYFTGNGILIDKNKTLEENKIKSGDMIIVNFNFF